MPQEKSSKLPTVIGLALAGTGAAHFVRPELFVGITKSAFPNDTDRYLKINGGLETALGLGLGRAEDAEAGAGRSAGLRRLSRRERRPQPLTQLPRLSGVLAATLLTVPNVTKVTDGTMLSRRNVLMGVVASAAGLALVRCGAGSSSQAAGVSVPATPTGPPPPPPWPELLAPPPAQARMLLPGGGVLSALPGPGDLLSLTLDDGVDSAVVRATASWPRTPASD